MKTKHTPGPWMIIQDASGALHVTDHGPNNYIARMGESGPKRDAKANARLIAASPDLLAAHEETLRLVGEKFGSLDLRGYSAADLADALHRIVVNARKAVRKAEGSEK